VYHGRYGCDTGCCGHWVELEGENARLPEKSGFTFSHPLSEEQEDFVRRIVTEEFGYKHVADIDWDYCAIVDSEDCPW
jgi:hypothetical protein